MTALKIALLGACGSGTSQLARRLAAALAERRIRADLVVAETIPPDAQIPDFQLVFLMGLGRVPAESESAQRLADELIRAALLQTQTPYRVIYGSEEQRLAKVLQAVHQISALAADGPPQKPDAAPNTSALPWSCDHCSDPACERRLLTDLLAQRTGLTIGAPASA